MPGQIPRTLGAVLYGLQEQNASSQVDTPGQVLLDVLAALGGLTTAGSALGAGVGAAVTWIAVGTGSGTPAVGDTTLFTEVARVPVFTTTLTGLATLCTGLLGAGIGSGWLTELGVFGGAATSASGSGTLYSHVALALPVLKNAAKQLVLQWSVQ